MLTCAGCELLLRLEARGLERPWSCMFVICVSISASFACTSWCDAIGLPAELHAVLRVVDRAVEARARRADDAPRDAEARRREARERALHPAHVREDRVLRDAHVLENELARHARAQAHLLVDGARLEALRVRRDEEAAHLAVDAADLRPDERDVREVAVGDPALRAVEDVASRRRRAPTCACRSGSSRSPARSGRSSR